jgi:hypothetical protein
MSFTRIQYDNCAYAEKINNSQKPMYYHLYKGQAEQCEPCASLDGPRGTRTYNNGEIRTVKRDPQLDMGNMTDVDSLLSNRGYPHVRCMTNRTLEEKQNKLKQLELNPVPNECPKIRRPEDSRLNDPVDNLRGIYIDRWEQPIINPSEWVYMWEHSKGNIQIGRNTKLAVKDTYKTRYPTPLPPTAQPL